MTTAPSPDITLSSELEALIRQAIADAKRHDVDTVGVEWLLAVLLESASGQAVLAACLPAARIAALDDQVKTMLAQQVVDDRSSRPWHLKLWPMKAANRVPLVSQQFENVLKEMILRALNSLTRQTHCADLMMAIVEIDNPAGAALREHGLSVWKLRSYLSHGLDFKNPFPDDGSTGNDTEVRLVLLNDNFTPMPFVIDMMTTVLGLPADDAEKRMLDVHRLGRGDGGVLPLAIARAKLHEIEARAQENHYPLRGMFELA